MDFFALTNTTGYIKAGNPLNKREKILTRPVDGGRQAKALNAYDGIDTSSVFADKLREAYEHRKYSHS